MLITANAGYTMLHQMDLTKGAYDLLSALADLQEPGGEVRVSQSELAARVGLSKNAASTAMALLVDRHLVLRPEGSYRLYILHSYIAGYESTEQLEAAIQAAGELPEPRYDTPPPKRHHRDLKAVSGA